MRLLFTSLACICMFLGMAACRTRGQGQDISASGTIEATEVNVSSKVSGNVLKLWVDEGSILAEGDSIAEVDHTIYDLQLAQAQANEKMAQANFKVLTDNYQSTLKLFHQGTATQKQKDELETRYKVAMAQLDAAQALAAQARQMASYCHITAPVAGIVTHKLVEKGELVSPGAALVTISQLDPLKLTIYVTESELGKVKVGQQAEVRIDSFPERAFPGKVVYISPVAEFTPKNIQTKEERVKLVFAVKIEIANPEGILKAGMPADAVLKTGNAAN